MIILGIETSCDDTCAAIVKATGRKTPRFEILSSIRSSQADIHREFGGVVPYLAARAHVENMNPVLKGAFQDAGYAIKDGKKIINLIAVTSHPGLIPCLLIGTSTAQTLAWRWSKPIIGVNHLDGHIYANWVNPIGVNPKSEIRNPKPQHYKSSGFKYGARQVQNIKFPAICLVVSGGHTQLVLMRGHGDFKIIGETRDDAAGEAFDKVAKLLGLPFPGGPPIERLAQSARNIAEQTQNNAEKIPRPSAFSQRKSARELQLPRPMIGSKDYDFSFSGLKTAVLYLVQKEFTSHRKLLISDLQLAALCAEFQQAIIDVLIAKTIRAAKQYNAGTVILGGGVAANRELRKQLGKAVKRQLPATDYRLPTTALAVDNAVMIAIAGYFDYLGGKSKTWKDIKARAVV